MAIVDILNIDILRDMYILFVDELNVPEANWTANFGDGVWASTPPGLFFMHAFFDWDFDIDVMLDIFNEILLNNFFLLEQPDNEVPCQTPSKALAF